MSTHRRHITAAVLLVSYLLASAGAWLHCVRECEVATDANASAVAPIATVCGCASHMDGRQSVVTPFPGGHGPGDHQSALLRDEPSTSPHHRHDDCTICRFQLTKKLTEMGRLAATVSGDCPEPIVLDLPCCQVAFLLATPESRAPPLTA